MRSLAASAAPDAIADAVAAAADAVDVWKIFST